TREGSLRRPSRVLSYGIILELVTYAELHPPPRGGIVRAILQRIREGEDPLVRRSVPPDQPEQLKVGAARARGHGVPLQAPVPVQHVEEVDDLEDRLGVLAA